MSVNFVYTWNGTFLATPADTEDESLGAQRIRDTKAAFGERFNVDHALPGNGLDGQHLQVTLQPTVVVPSLDTGNGLVFAQAIAGNTELLYKDSSGVVTQITSGGALMVSGKFVGEIFDFAEYTAPPPQCLACVGTAVSRTTYSKLFAVIGTTWGAGDGSTTFNVPDLRGRVRANADLGAGVNTTYMNGSVVGVLGGSQQPHQHNHTINDPGHTHAAASGANFVLSGTGGYTGDGAGAQQQSATTATATTGITVNTALSGTSGNIQPTAVVTTFIYAGQ